MTATARRGARYSDDEPQREAENRTTTNAAVLSWLRWDNVSEARNTYELPTSGGIVRSIATVDRLFEDVERTSEPLKSFSTVAGLVPKVQVQRAAFHHYCKLLLVTVAKSSQDVENMIEDPGHPVWKDHVVHRNINKVMARFYHMSSNVLEKLQENLRSLEVGFQALRAHEKRKTRVRLCRSKSMAFSTTETLPDLVQNLRNYNDLFLTLILQAVPRQSRHMLGSTFPEDMGYLHDVRAASPSPSRLDLDYMQRVLQDFYHTVSDRWTCHDHESHLLSILLEFDHARAGALLRSEGFRFIIAVTSPDFDRPYFFFINSPSGGSFSCQTVEEDRSSKKKCLVNNLTGAAVRTKPSDSLIDRAGNERGGVFRLPGRVRARKHDLRVAEDLCHCLRSLEAERETGLCSLRYLESGSGLRFVLSPAFRHEDQRQGSHSLDDILCRASSEGRAIPTRDRLRTASSLAAGILHLNTSSWLPQVWSSKDIYYFDVNDDGRCALGEPFLQTSLDIHRSRRSVFEETDSTGIRSNLLCLGLVLIELAFSAPWQRLQIQEDLTNELSTEEKDLLNMMRLSNTVSRQLGPRYARVVQTCLSQGLEKQRTRELRKAEVDGFIFEEVVKELDNCLSVVTSNPGLYSNPSMKPFSNGSISKSVPSSTENYSVEDTD